MGKKILNIKKIVVSACIPGGWGAGVLPFKRLMGMCCWIGSHFHDWIDYNGIAFSIVTKMGRTFLDFWGKRVVHIYGLKCTRMFVPQMKSKGFFSQFKKWVNS